jgi:hypothetical protein
MMGPSELARDEFGDDEAYSTLVRRLILARPEKLILSDEALEVMHAIRQDLHSLESVSTGLVDGFQAFVGKLAGYAGRLALILHMAADPEAGGTYAIGETTVENVKRLVLNFILPHAFVFYRTAESAADGDRLKKIASWVLTSGKTRIVASDLVKNIRDLRGLGLFDLNRQVSPLVAGGWLEPGERPAKDFTMISLTRALRSFSSRLLASNRGPSAGFTVHAPIVTIVTRLSRLSRTEALEPSKQLETVTIVIARTRR